MGDWSFPGVDCGRGGRGRGRERGREDGGEGRGERGGEQGDRGRKMMLQHQQISALRG